ncbi:MAG TPA: RraA family protein, partial [Minicystis sp.]|nr:RraA family protein [Minicystis sp.]
MADAPREPELRALDASFERPSAELVAGLAALGPAALGDVLDPSCALRHEIRGLWPGAPRVAGPALTVRTGRHDNLMLHAAIYLAQPGDVLVVEAGCDEAASAGGNVCAIAARRGVRGLVVDGVVRDVAEMQAAGFPVFARGVSPVPGRRVGAGSVASQIRCGGVVVDP